MTYLHQIYDYNNFRILSDCKKLDRCECSWSSTGQLIIRSFDNPRLTNIWSAIFNRLDFNKLTVKECPEDEMNCYLNHSELLLIHRIIINKVEINIILFDLDLKNGVLSYLHEQILESRVLKNSDLQNIGKWVVHSKKPNLDFEIIDRPFKSITLNRNSDNEKFIANVTYADTYDPQSETIIIENYYNVSDYCKRLIFVKDEKK